MDVDKALDPGERKTFTDMKEGNGGATEEGDEERKGIIYGIMFYERKGGRNRGSKCLGEATRITDSS